MSSSVEFVPLGGTVDRTGNRPGIGGSAYALIDKSTSSAILVDCGAYPHRHASRERETEIALGVDDSETDAYMVVGEDIIPDMPDFSHDSLSGYIDVSLTDLSELNMPGFEPLAGIDKILVIVTHAHVDHIGALPSFVKVFPSATVCMTQATLDISMWSWRDSLRIAAQDGHMLLYDENDIDELRDNIKIICNGGKMELGPFSATFFPAGHILGAIGVYVTPTSKTVRMPNVFFTGDSSVAPQHTIPSAQFPTKRVDILITDSTYGGERDREERTIVENRIAEAVLQCLLNGGRVLCPVLTVGRSAELYATLYKYGIVDRFPVYIDGAARTMAEIYAEHGCAPPGMLDRFLVGKARRESINRSDDPHVMIVSGGMLNGLAILHAAQYAPRAKDLILYSSYLAPCSHAAKMMRTRPGQRFVLWDASKKRVILNTTLRAQVMQYGYIAHLLHEETLEMVNQMRPSRTFTVHGDDQAMDALISDSPWHMEKAYLGERYKL